MRPSPPYRVDPITAPSATKGGGGGGGGGGDKSDESKKKIEDVGLAFSFQKKKKGGRRRGESRGTVHVLRRQEVGR